MTRMESDLLTPGTRVQWSEHPEWGIGLVADCHPEPLDGPQRGRTVCVAYRDGSVVTVWTDDLALQG